MKKYDFDQVIDRRNTNSIKWDRVSGDLKNVIPMSIADMDFLSPPEVLDALRMRVKHGVFGYTLMNHKQHDAVLRWIIKRHGQNVPSEWLFATSGVICTMRAATYALTQPGDKVIIQTPIYRPFFSTAAGWERALVVNPLICVENNKYIMDLDHLEKCFNCGARFLLFCSPHNPVGRVWSLQELNDLSSLCIKYDVTVISDEIHRDLVFQGFKHIPLASLPGMERRVVTVFSCTKTFNIPGFYIGSAIIADTATRGIVKKWMNYFGRNRPDTMSIIAQTAAYQHGEIWLNQVLCYINDNFTAALDLLKDLPLKANRPEGTYLMWVDCSKLNMNTVELLSFMINEACVYPEPGHIFYSSDQTHNGLEHHFRLNLAMPRSIVVSAMQAIRAAVKKS